jgi:hypothetical protein
MERDQVVIAEFNNEIDAEIAKGHLESAGISASIVKDDAGGMFPSMQNTEGVRLTVAEGDESLARAILAEKHL